MEIRRWNSWTKQPKKVERGIVHSPKMETNKICLQKTFQTERLAAVENLYGMRKGSTKYNLLFLYLYSRYSLPSLVHRVRIFRLEWSLHTLSDRFSNNERRAVKHFMHALNGPSQRGWRKHIYISTNKCRATLLLNMFEDINKFAKRILKSNRTEFSVCSAVLFCCSFLLLIFVCLVLYTVSECLRGVKLTPRTHIICDSPNFYFHFIRSTWWTPLFKLKFITAYEINWMYGVIWIHTILQIEEKKLSETLGSRPFVCKVWLVFYQNSSTLSVLVDTFQEIEFDYQIQLLLSIK